MMQIRTILISLLLLAFGGCASHFSPYRMDIRQGNFVTPEMRDKLKLGMTKQQVRYVLGTPLLNDAFHSSRWDYAYSLAKKDKPTEQQAMILYFEGDNLTRIEDGAMPALLKAAETAQPASAVAATPAADVPVVVAPVVAPVVAASSVPVAATADAAVKSSVQAWADAWTARDVKRYLAAYAPSFKYGGVNHATWLKQRTQHLRRPGSFSVSVSDVTVKLKDETHATASFKQDFYANAHHDITRKTLQLQKIAGAWLIVSEKIEK